MGNLIPRRHRRYAGGNYGKPSDAEKKAKSPVFPEEYKTRKLKRNKKAPRITYEQEFYGCPFCRKVLPRVYSEEAHRKVWLFRGYIRFRSMGGRSHKCECGARTRIRACPCCKRDTWFKAGVYKHQSKHIGCGFTGFLLAPSASLTVPGRRSRTDGTSGKQP